MKGHRVRLPRLIGLIVAAVLCAAMAVIMVGLRTLGRRSSEAPSAAWMAIFQKSLDRDHVPILADTLIACENDPESCVGEGSITGDWMAYLKGRKVAKASSKFNDVIVTLSAGRAIRVMSLGGERVRVLAGPGVNEAVATRFFDEQMQTGTGSRPLYKTP